MSPHDGQRPPLRLLPGARKAGAADAPHDAPWAVHGAGEGVALRFADVRVRLTRGGAARLAVALWLASLGRL